MVHRVLFLDDDEDLRAITVEWLRNLGVACDAVATVAELKAMVEERGAAFDVVILDINLGPGEPSGVDAYRWLLARGFAGRIAFLTGHARTHPLVATALSAGAATVYEKPVSAKVLEQLVA